ncbi:MmgE/PrpD family protein [Candidimonas humi]|jgi:2-methylcitrate dehydratase PrpD|uniref:MmgE/PrpD family protein n=1 Tax=Candidimonas humi TaxID=683355 RepID=A0ABV8P2K0_9BURK|nr:MmgE/PrpD family protein [Candidimonas humi]MBV6307304.1 MmgE/PrpD family protein [Candidimonas humi]
MNPVAHSSIASKPYDQGQPCAEGDAEPTRRLATFAAGLNFEDIPAWLVERIRLHVLDGIGVCLHGARLPWTRYVADMVLGEGGNPVASLWGYGGETRARTSVTQAVLVNCTAGHAFEMDDIHKESVLHPNSLAVPVAFALAQALPGITGRDITTAIVSGYEVGARVGNAATTALFLNGFHPQGVTGTFVAAATAGRLLGLDPQAMQHALGIAGSMGAGLMAAQEGAMVKRLHAGRAGQSGVYAALLAKRGFTGIENILEADYGGFLSAFARTPHMERLLEGLGTQWEAGKVGFKMYPNVTSMHAALDAFRQLQLEHGLQAADIDRIAVGCGHMTYVHVAWPYRPTSVTAAQMNLFYGLAVMALRGSLTVDDYDADHIDAPDVMEFMQRIHPFEDERIENRGPAFRHAATVRVHTRSGMVLSKDVWERRGSPENPVSSQEVEEKFFANVAHRIPDGAARRITALAGRLDSLAAIDELTSLL